VPPTPTPTSVARLEESDLAAADAVFRLAFGTALGLAEPKRFAEGAELVRTRWLADPACAFKAESRGELVGCAFITRWGSCALFGPLAVHPDYWDRGVGRLLWEVRLPFLDRWDAKHAALFTRTETKNVHLYQKFGFWPGFLTALTAKQLDAAPRTDIQWRTFAELPADERGGGLDDCRRLTDAVHPGLDLEREIRALDLQGLGDTILVDDDGLCGFAVCHAGAGSEAGPGACYVKFAAVVPGEGAPRRFERLLDACEGYAAAGGFPRLVAGVNTGRHEAYRSLLERGHRPFALGVAMHRPNEPAYDRPGVYVLDDRR
jgi:N-acetylglutamate synthase-like GNAT family acetyltransferase